jgi:hypothetical protein
MNRKLLTFGAATALAAAPAAAVAANGSTAVTATAKPATVTFGKATTISGKATGKGSAGASVALQHDAYPFDGHFTEIRQTTANQTGDYLFSSIRPGVNNHYRVVAKTKPRATSPVVTVNVRPRVTLSVSDSTPAKGQRVRFHGTVLPQHNGKQVLIQKRTSKGWVTAAKTTLKATTPLKGVPRSKYSRRLRVSSTRYYRAVVVPADGDHVPGKSRKRKLVVH